MLDQKMLSIIEKKAQEIMDRINNLEKPANKSEKKQYEKKGQWIKIKGGKKIFIRAK